jgi:hypothetical protein
MNGELLRVAEEAGFEGHLTADYNRPISRISKIGETLGSKDDPEDCCGCQQHRVGKLYRD